MANGIQKDLGKVTAYSYAKAAGYTGTEEQFQAIFNEFTENAPGLIDRMDTAVERAEAAVTNIDATVQDAVDDAVEEATASAVATANQAVSDAQAAQTAAEGAVTQANNAVTQANAAVTAAQAAQSAAEDAAESFVLDRTLTDSGAAAPADLVGDLKTALSIEHLNLYSGIGNTLERFVNESTGALQFNASFQTSDYIDVSKYAGKKLVVAYTFSGGFYDATKTYIENSGIGNSRNNDVVVSVPANAAFCRVSCNNAEENLLQIGASVSRDNYIDYDVIKLANLNLNNYFEQENLFNKATALPNKYISPSTGNVSTLNNYSASDWIEIGTGNYVTASANVFDLVVYNADKTFSRNVERKYDNYPYTTKLTGTEKYIRLSAKTVNVNTVKAERNLGESVFVPYGGSLASKYLEDSAYKQTNVIVGDGCYFTTINSALTAITENTVKNRYVIFVTEGTYNETITTKDYVDIEGESKYKSVINYISDDESDYSSRSAIFATTYTTLKNLTVKTTGSKYPLHCDARYNEPYELVCKNCIFQHDGFTGEKNPAGTAVGIGLYWGQHVKLEECDCVGSGLSGCASIYCHNSSENDASHSRFRSLSIKNCILSNATYGLRLDAIENNTLQANECVYIGNKNNGTTPVQLNAVSNQSWHVFSVGNSPDYTQT